MNEQRRKYQRGFTLVEILTAVAVFAVVMIAALLIYDRSNRVFKQGVEASNLQQNTRVAFDKVVADLRMAGFDYDRDGIPTVSVGGSNLYQQPDEQFEYVGPHALTIRGNFDYEREAQPCSATVTSNCDHGREGTPYENTQFPLVTTGNDEIVTYALVPDSQTTIPACNGTTNCIEFYADIHVPRLSYPDPSAGGQDENLVQIPGVDLCVGGCNNPPYTLYRFTINANGTINRVPLASNIRSMSFSYFQDAQGAEPLKNLANDAAVDVSTIRGLGQYVVGNSAALVVERELRSKINSVHVELIGMNENVDRSFTQRTGTVTDTVAPNNRQYRLDTLVAPRNILRRGMREQDVYPPGPPTLNAPCTGPCGGVYLQWVAPPVSAGYGAAEQYKIIYGPRSGTGYPCETTTFTQTATHLFGTGVSCSLTPNVEYKFAVVALNGYGSNVSNEVYATPLNSTRPVAPTIVSASNNLNGQILLTWTRPTTSTGSVSCGPTFLPAAEIMGYKIERAAAATQPAANSPLWTMLGSAPITMSSAYDTVTWTDSTAANCTTYWYRITAIEKCSLQANYNVGSDINLGSSNASNAVSGVATSSIKPATPGDLQVDLATYSCDATGTNCSAHMSWPKVTQDEMGNPINVTEYVVYRRPKGTTVWVQEGVQTTIPATGSVTYASTLLDISGGKQYEFTVTARQCTSLESNRFPTPRSWPCAFPTGIVATAMLSGTGAVDGDGSSAAPWMFYNATDSVTVHLNVTDATQIQSAIGRVYTAAGTFKTTLTATAATGWNFNWSVANDTIEHIVVTVTENGGCTRVETAYAGDLSQNCCLTPKSIDGTVVSFTSGTQDVDIVLKNECGVALTLFTDLTVTWNRTGGQKLETVTFIPPTGSSTVATIANANQGDSPLTVSIPIGTPTVPAGTTTYKIRVHFKNTTASNPITGFTVNYRRSTDTLNQSCPVVP